MLLTQAIRRAAQVNPNEQAFIDSMGVCSWPEFVGAVSRFAGALHRQGVSRGDRVAILGLNSTRYLQAMFAVWWAGAVVTPLNTRWSAAENAYALSDSGAVGLVCDDAFLERAQALTAGDTPVRVKISIGREAAPGWSPYESLLAEAPIECLEVADGDLAGIYYTGGTTGFPKGVMLSPLAIWSTGVSLAAHLKLDQKVRFLHAAPMFHVADGVISMAVTIVAGCHAFVPQFDPKAVIEMASRHRLTQLQLVPTMIGMMLDSLAQTSADLSCVKSVVYGGSAIPESTLRRAVESLPNAQFVQCYGQTELGPLATVLPAEAHALDGPESRLSSAGVVAYGAEMRIAGPDGQPVPLGEIGEIWVRGPGAMLGYWNKPEETAAALQDGWVRTGDAAIMDAEGYIRICDRLKDMIVTGGENVFSLEVENAIASHPDVEAVAVIGVPDAVYGERVHAIVVPRPGVQPTLESIVAHCRPRIAGYKCPRSLDLRADPLPLTAAGKVQKGDLRAPFWQGAERRVG